jgi:PAS domain S-box-containing protein
MSEAARELTLCWPQADEVAIEELPLAYIELDMEGTVVRVNRHACDIFEGEPEEVLGKPAWEYMAADQIATSRESFLQARTSRDGLSPVRRSIYVKSGAYRTFDLYRSYVRDRNGKPTGIRHFAAEVSQTIEEHDKAVRARAWLESIVDSIAEAMIVTDGLGFIRLANLSVEGLTGWLPSELVGEVVERRLPILKYTPSDGVPLNHHTRLERPCRGIATMLDRKRYQIRVEMLSSPIVDKESGFVSGAAITLRPVGDAGTQQAG